MEVITKKAKLKQFIDHYQFKKLYIIFYPICVFFYYLFFLWLLKKNSWIKTNLSPLWKMINSVFLSSPAGIFASFFLPMVLILVLSNVMHVSVVLGGTIANIPALIFATVMPIVLVDFKRSTLLKRLFISKFKPKYIIISFLLYFGLISFISILINFSLGTIIFKDKVIDMGGQEKIFDQEIGNIKWHGLFIGIFLNILIFASLGIFVSSFAKNSMTALAIGLLLVLPGAFLSGQYLSPAMIEKNKVMEVISYFFPQKYSTNIVIASMKGHDVFNLSNFYLPIGAKKDKNIIIGVNEELILNKELTIASLLVPIFFSLPLTYYSIKTFKWMVR